MERSGGPDREGNGGAPEQRLLKGPSCFAARVRRGPGGSEALGGEQPPGGDEDAVQGPDGDDPLGGFADDADDPLPPLRDLLEPGLDEAQLGEAELAAVREDRCATDDETGTRGGDEAEAAGSGFDPEADLLSGSDPIEPPGAADGLFDEDDLAGATPDTGEEGIDDDLGAEFDETPGVRTDLGADDATGPMDDERDVWIPALRPIDPRRLAAVIRLPPLPSGSAAAATWWRGAPIVFAAPDATGEGGAFALTRAGTWRPLAPPIGGGGEEAQRVRSIAVIEPPGAAAGTIALCAATDRGMIFRVGIEGDGGASQDWAVERSYVTAAGSNASWLPLGIVRLPFRFVAAGGAPGAWAWRPGGPLLFARSDGAWAVVDDAPGLRAFASDPDRPHAALFLAGDDGAQIRNPKSEIRNPKSHGLPPAAAGVAVSPAACAATAGGRLWLGCGDPAAPLLRSDDGGISWSAVGGPTAVRELAAAAGAAVVLTVDPVGETDAIVAIGDDGSAVTLLDGTDLAALAGRGDGALRVDQLALSRDPRPRLCVLAGGRAFAVDLPEAGPTPSGGKDEEDAA